MLHADHRGLHTWNPARATEWRAVR
jgi:hypothetical protein